MNAAVEPARAADKGHAHTARSQVVSGGILATGRFTAVVLAETRAEVLKAVRLPAFILPVLLFPAMFYVLFGLVMGGSVGPTAMPAYLLGSYGAFGVIGAALFGMGVSVAAERGQGWLTLKRATPMPPLAYFTAKVIMSILVGACIMLVLGGLAGVFGDVRLPVHSWVLLFGTLSLGAVPFCALGCVLGYSSGPTSAPAIANLIYLPMSFASGLWIPIQFLPELMQRIAPALPPYHLAALAHGVITGDTAGAGVHIVALAGFTTLFLGAAVFAYRRDDDRTWG
jgi:ABC-2 type transport system permease protein